MARLPPVVFCGERIREKEAAYGTIYMWVTARTRWKHRVVASSVELTLAYHEKIVGTIPPIERENRQSR